MSDAAIKFIFDHKDEILKHKTFEQAMDALDARGVKLSKMFRDCAWLPYFFDTLKAYPDLQFICKDLRLPYVKCLSEIFTDLSLEEGNGLTISTPLNGHYGGKMKVMEGKSNLTLSGDVKFKMLRGKLREKHRAALERGMLAEVGSFDLHTREDYHLLTVRDKTGIGSRWVCFLPLDYDFAAVLPPEQQQMLIDHKERKTQAAEALKEHNAKGHGEYSYNKAQNKTVATF